MFAEIPDFFKENISLFLKQTTLKIHIYFKNPKTI